MEMEVDSTTAATEEWEPLSLPEVATATAAVTPLADAPSNSTDGSNTVGISHNHLTPGQELMLNFAEQLRLTVPKLIDGSIADYYETEQRIIQDGYGSDLAESDDTTAKRHRRILLFAYGRRLYEDDETKRKEAVASMLQSPFKQITRLICTKATGDFQQTIQMRCWIDHVQSFGRLDNRAVNIFHDQSMRIVRSVAMGICSRLHAGAVVQCYKVQFSRDDRLCRMVDISAYIRRHFDSHDFMQFINTCEVVCGAHVHKLLAVSKYAMVAPDKMKTVFEDDNNDIDKSMAHNKIDAFPGSSLPSCELERLLKQYGPAMVWDATVDKRFFDYKQPLECSLTGNYELPSFVDENAKDSPYPTAMVLVAMRHVKHQDDDDDSGGQWRLLCQHWSNDMQFVELSQEYFCAMDAMLTFIIPPQLEFPAKYELCVAEHEVDEAVLDDVALEEPAQSTTASSPATVASYVA